MLWGGYMHLLATMPISLYIDISRVICMFRDRVRWQRLAAHLAEPHYPQ